MNLLAAIPLPPIHFKASGFQDVFSIAQFVVCGAMFLYAFRELRRGNGPVMLWCLIGGFLASLWEPIVDVLGQCWLPSRGQHWESFTLLNRHVPLMMPFVYSWFVGGQAYLYYRVFQKGATRRRLFELWGVVFLVNIALETPGVVAHVYTYYGKQPMNLWGWPMWWGFVNPLMPMIAAALIYKVKPHIEKQAGAWAPWAVAVAVIMIVPGSDGVANAFGAWPVIAALNMDVGYVGTWIASFMCLGLCAFIVYIIGLAVARPAAALATPAAPPSPVHAPADPVTVTA